MAIEAVPLTTDHVPVCPAAGVLAASVNRLLLQFVCAAPAFATGVLLVNVTFELVEQLPFVIAHFNTAGLDVTVTELVLEFTFVIVAAPLTTDHVPVSPEATELAAILKTALLHLVCAEPALAVVKVVFVKVTVEFVEQLPFVIVHLNTAGLDVTVTLVTGELVLVIEAEPLTTDHAPVSPEATAFAAMVNDLLLQFVIAGPAFAIVDVLFVKVTVDVDVQVPFVIVHLSTAGLVVTITVLVGEFILAIVAAPLTTDHAPVSPEPAAFAASVNELLLHFVCEDPALAVVGTLLVNVTVDVDEQLPFVIVHLNTAGLEVTVTELVLEFTLEIVAAPLTTDHVPVSPEATELAAIVKTALLHLV